MKRKRTIFRNTEAVAAIVTQDEAGPRQTRNRPANGIGTSAIATTARGKQPGDKQPQQRTEDI